MFLFLFLLSSFLPKSPYVLLSQRNRKALASIAAACTSTAAVRASGARTRDQRSELHARGRSLAPVPAAGARARGGEEPSPYPWCRGLHIAGDENPPEPCWARVCS